MTAVGETSFHYMTYSETWKKTSLKWLNEFILIWHECSLGGPLRFFEEILIQQKHGRQGRGLFLCHLT